MKILSYSFVLIAIKYIPIHYVECQGKDNYDVFPEDMKLILNTEGCKIHEFRVRYPELPADFGWWCDKRLVEVYKSYDNIIKFETLKHFDSCCYRMSQYNGMNKVQESPCLNFTNGTEVKLTTDFISIGCNAKGKPYYTDRFAFIKQKQVKALVNKDAYSVLMLGLDSVSRHRAYTHLKNTVNYLVENEWLDFRGHHKVAGRTYPNVMSVITGNTSMPEHCDTLVKCKQKMIWDKYKDSGYITGLGEDAAAYSIFYYINETVTHHYLNPYLKTIERRDTQGTRCAGKLHSGLHVLNYALDFARTYRFRRSIGYFWISTFAHDLDNNLKSADDPLMSFFEELKWSGVLERSFIMFFADHGVGFGMADQEIFPENRLPMFFMWVPPRFRKKHPKLYRNMLTNQNRLTTPYNIHMTLYGILKMANKTVAPYTPIGCPNCSSLFREIPGNRDCVTAGIAEQYCSCNAVPVSSSSDDAQYCLMEALIYIENVAALTRTMPCTMCYRYEFDKVYRVQTYRYGNTTDRTFLLTLKMQPYNTVFEVTVKRTLHKSGGATTLLKSDEKWNLAVMRKSLKNQYEYKAQTISTISQFSDKEFRDWCAVYPRNRYFCVCVWDRPADDCDKDLHSELIKFVRAPIEEVNF